MKNYSLFLASVILFLFPFYYCNSQEPCKPAAEYIFEQYKKYNIIAIAEGPHGTLNTHEFLRNLLKNDKINETVQVIIIEFANISYQRTLDRYISGEDLLFIELQKVWRETTQAHNPLFEEPVYFKLLKTIRDINFTLAAKSKIRVLAGDPPIDWSKINTQKDFFSSLSQRDVFPSQLAIKYGIDSAHKVLLIYGDAHLSKLSDEKKDSTFWTIPFFINKKYPNRIFTINMFVSGNYEKELKNLNIPENAICDLTESSIGMFPFKNDYNPADTSLILKNVFDAICYVGPSAKWEEDMPGMIDSVYWNELNRRSNIVWGEGIDPKLLETK